MLDAAAACFAETGYGVALEKIADRAGVGRGTLYRNFRDRMALALAIFEREVDQLETIVVPDRPFRVVMEDMIRKGIRAAGLFVRLASELPLKEADRTAFEALRQRVETIVAPVVERAHAAGELRTDVTAAQFVLATRMVNGVLLPLHTDAQLSETIREAIDLLLTGLRP